MLLILAAFSLTILSGVPGLLFRSGRNASQKITTLLHLVGCTAGLAAVIGIFTNGEVSHSLAWPLPGGTILLRADPLSAFFLLPVFVVMGAGSIYGEGYWPENVNAENGRKLRFFYGVLTAGLMLVMIAGDAWSFLTGWEIVGLSSFFLVTTESKSNEALRAGWIYLIAAHVSTLTLFAMFSAIHAGTGTWQLSPVFLKDASIITPILILALVGFGVKAGIMPFHVWLPEAHAAAPSHVSAVLSGIVLKMGIYGLVRIITLFPMQHWFGLTLLFTGIASGVLGVVFALAQHDLKRLLAYHSIENIGIILMGLGAGVLGQNQTWGMLAMAGGLLHVWNHAFFKSLLFYAAGSVVHATGTRTIDELGGLLRKMRATGISFLIGAVAICGLPPLNGFVSEWLIYLASFRKALGEGAVGDSAIFAAPALALIGGLAVACFVKAFSVIFLGSPRSLKPQLAHAEPISMRIAMGLLAAICVVIGVWPLVVSGALSQAIAVVFPEQSASAPLYALFSKLPIATLILLTTIVLAGIILATRTKNSRKAATWDCGYAAPTSRMQYTASSFAATFVELFRWVVQPETEQHGIPGKKLFPAESSFETHVPDPVLEGMLIPGVTRGQQVMVFLRFLQAGRTQIYILYIVATLLILLAWSAR